MIQAIVIADQRFERYRRCVDFIQRYIFPGSLLPSIAVISDCVARVTDLRLSHLEEITPHYARTLRCWRERFLSNLEEIRSLGFSEHFIRLWEFYFCYCEGRFLERTIGDVQLVFSKPLNRRAPITARV